MAKLANAVDTQIAIVKETTWGVTPSNPAFQKMRITGESLTAGLTTVASQELRPDRNVTDLALVAASAAGGINFEMSYSTFDMLLEALLFGNWTGNVLTNGQSSNMKSFTIEKRFDVGDGNFEYFRYAGMVPNTMTINLAVDSIITGSFEFMGKSEEAGTSLIPGASYAEPTINPVLNATRDFASFSLGGLTDCYVMSMDMTISNNLRSQRAVAHLRGIGVGTGQFSVTGSMNVYFKSRALYDKFLKNEGLAFSFILGEEGGKQYKFTLPWIKFSEGTVQAGGLDSDLMCEMQYQALFSPAINGTLRIERGIGASAVDVPATGVTLDMKKLSLTGTNKATLIATVHPDNATDKSVTWASDHDEYATVENGVVAAVAPGTATITVTTTSGSHQDTCEVTVS